MSPIITIPAWLPPSRPLKYLLISKDRGVVMPHAGHTLARILASIFQRQRQEVIAAIRQGQPLPDLSRWLPVLTQLVTPLLAPLWRRGAQQALRRQAQLSRRPLLIRHSLQGFVAKRETPGATGPAISFDLFNTKIEQAIQQAVFSFCRETLDTLRVDLDTGIAKLREALLAGAREGATSEGRTGLAESYQQINARVNEIFNDSFRANRIAVTESSRATNGGMWLADKETGIVTQKTWLASGDACKLCLELADMGPIPLDEPFKVFTKGAPAYRIVMYPPAHVFCMCSYTSAL